MCALFLGIACYSLPVITYYNSWKKLTEEKLRFIDYETPDEILFSIQNPSIQLRSFLNEFVTLVEEGIPKSTFFKNIFFKKNYNLSGTKYSTFKKFFFDKLRKTEFNKFNIDYDFEVEQLIPLISSWKDELSTYGFSYIDPKNLEEIQNISNPFGKSTFFFTFAEPQLSLMGEIKDQKDTEDFVKRVNSHNGFVLIFVLDHLLKHIKYKQNKNGLTFSEIRNIRGLKNNEVVQLFFIFKDLSDIFLDQGEAPVIKSTDTINYYLLTIPTQSMSILNNLICRPGVFWFIESTVYYLRKLSALTGLPSPAGYTLSNVFVKHKNINDLINLAPKDGYGCVIDAPSISIIRFKSEYDYTFSTLNGNYYFRTYLNSGKYKKWSEDVGLEEFGGLKVIVDLLMYGQYVLKSTLFSI